MTKVHSLFFACLCIFIFSKTSQAEIDVEQKAKSKASREPSSDIIPTDENGHPTLSVDDLPVVQPVQKNSIPSTKYENLGAEPVRMPHPNAEKGLTRITSDQKYIYSRIESPRSGSTSVHFGMFNPKNLVNPDNGNLSFDTIYDKPDALIVLIDLEWKIFENFGKFKFQLGTGVYSATGKGRFKNDPDPSHEAKESFTFMSFPLTGNLIYRFQFWDKQWFMPYVGGGAGGIGFIEMRDDKKGPKFGGAGIAQAFGGGALSLNSLAPNGLGVLDEEYGVNQMWLTAEYRQIFKLSKFDFSGEIINVGFLVEY